MSGAWHDMLQWEAAEGIERGPEHHGPSLTADDAPELIRDA